MKPARYIGQEWNLPKKDFNCARIKFALCFPDLYELGMSNLGIRILYAILNNIPDVLCERVFACAPDMEHQLRQNHLELSCLESGRPLREFDMIGFSLGSELTYTNVLNVLDLGSVPLQSFLRDHTHPLVIGGGPCVVNPEPIHDFFDLFVIGEAEEVIVQIIDTYRMHKEKFKSAKISKQELLFIFSQIQGVYVPSLYEVTYGPQGRIKEFRPKVEGVPNKVKKCFVSDLDKAFFPKDWLVPYIQIIHDRISLEIMRGCPNTCRFCQARHQYYPYRQRGVEALLDLAQETFKRTGYEEISLSGLSVSDYANIEALLKNLIDTFKPEGVSISLPSIRPKTVVGNLSSLIASVKKSTLTFAPEAATERLRKILAKEFDMSEFLQVIRQAYQNGYRHLKLYFMIGLPYEEDEDLDGIIDFSTLVSEERRGIARSAAEVNISINALIPKPHTPLQWFKMQDLEVIRRKQDYLKKKIRNRRLNFSFHNCYMSFLEGVFSRGDRRLSPVILSAFRRGARFDGWENYFVFDNWVQAFREAGIDPQFYLQKKSEEEILPWDFLDLGIDKDRLIDEYHLAI